jgi:ketosteroid isomerase-like protein
MNRRSVLHSLSLLALTACVTSADVASLAQLEQRVADTERAFAASMAARDFAAFQGHLAEDAIFIGNDGPLRGKAEIAAGWQRYFEGDEAPFSWRPELVTVLQSGSLALSTGPVYNPAGACVGTFTSIWRRNTDDSWSIVFDRGGSDCGERPAP